MGGGACKIILNSGKNTGNNASHLSNYLVTYAEAVEQLQVRHPEMFTDAAKLTLLAERATSAIVDKLAEQTGENELKKKILGE